MLVRVRWITGPHSHKVGGAVVNTDRGGGGGGRRRRRRRRRSCHWSSSAPLSPPVTEEDYCSSLPRTRGRFLVDMAEYTQTGILAALLLFSAVTLRDIYVGRNQQQNHNHQQNQQAAESLGLASDGLPDPGTLKPGKPALYTGPVLKFQYWWVTLL